MTAKQLNNTTLLAIAEEAARAAGDMLRGREARVFSSIGRDIKLDADQAAHDLLIEKLSGSGIPVLSEEGTHDFSHELCWIIDPLDGSFNFSRGVPLCAVSIALVQKGEPMLGVVYDFNRDELFSAAVGKGATLNSQPITVSTVADKSQAVIATGFPAHSDFSSGALAHSIELLQQYKKVRLLGSAALSLAWVACGRVDAYYEKDIYLWDVAAGLALVKAAGGDYSKTTSDKEGKCTVLAGNKEGLTGGI